MLLRRPDGRGRAGNEHARDEAGGDVNGESKPPPGAQPFSRAVLTGCLLGLVLAGSWALFGIALYALMRALSASLALSVICGGAGGPVIGSALVMAWWLWKYPAARAALGARRAKKDEPAQNRTTSC